MPMTRVVFEVEDCDLVDEAVERIRAGDIEPVEASVEEDD